MAIVLSAERRESFSMPSAPKDVALLWGIVTFQLKKMEIAPRNDNGSLVLSVRTTNTRKEKASPHEEASLHKDPWHFSSPREVMHTRYAVDGTYPLFIHADDPRA